MKIQRNPVESSQIASAGYDPLSMSLDIEFKPFKKPKEGEEPPPTTTYRYSNVTPEMFADFQSSESKGKWVNQTLKALPGSHPHRKLTQEEAAQ